MTRIPGRSALAVMVIDRLSPSFGNRATMVEARRTPARSSVSSAVESPWITPTPSRIAASTLSEESLDHAHLVPVPEEAGRHPPAHPPEAADDDVVLHASDSPFLSLHRGLCDPLRQSPERVTQGCHSAANEKHREDPASRRERLHLGVAHRRDRDDRHVERVRQIPRFDPHEPERAGDDDPGGRRSGGAEAEAPPGAQPGPRKRSRNAPAGTSCCGRLGAVARLTWPGLPGNRRVHGTGWGRTGCLRTKTGPPVLRPGPNPVAGAGFEPATFGL